MATCPRCLGPLTENHRCPTRTVVSRMTSTLTTVVIGGLIGGSGAFLIDDQPAGAVVLAAAALGVVLTGALRQAIGGPRT